MAATLALPFADAVPWPALLDELRARGVSIVATTPDPEAEAIARVANRLRDTPIALLVGSEGHGLSAGALVRADVRARIPIAAGVDSLNAATAAAIALYELGREGHRRD
jgi:tRNA G18 (ribose-2'-O)-methylase SpoU